MFVRLSPGVSKHHSNPSPGRCPAGWHQDFHISADAGWFLTALQRSQLHKQQNVNRKGERGGCHMARLWLTPAAMKQHPSWIFHSLSYVQPVPSWLLYLWDLQYVTEQPNSMPPSGSCRRFTHNVDVYLLRGVPQPAGTGSKYRVSAGIKKKKADSNQSLRDSAPMTKKAN